jgi:hypothetical protein
MDAAGRSTFVAGYTKILANAWSDESFRQRLNDDPHGVLAESGIEIPADGKVEIVNAIAGDANLDEQVELWEQGTKSGNYRLYVPGEPQVDTAELSEGELAGVAGGATYCCCCSPCCTCG